MAGHGKQGAKNVNHARCTKSVLDYIVDQSLIDIVFVGHSFGGTIISKLSEAIPERIKRLVFLNAFVLRDGHCLLDEIPPDHRVLFDRLAREFPDDTVMLPFPIWREAFINDADLELAQQTYALLSPEPCQPLRDKLDRKKFYSLEIPKSYINCTEDVALPPGE